MALAELPHASGLFAVYADDDGWDQVLAGATCHRQVAFGPVRAADADRYDERGSVAEPPELDDDPYPRSEYVRNEAAIEAAKRLFPHRRDKPIFIGRASRDLAREVAAHFADGSTRRSSLRRSLVATVGFLHSWDWQSSAYDAGGMPSMAGARRFELTARDEPHLSTWMTEHLSIGWTTDLRHADDAAFRALLQELRPALRLDTDRSDPLTREVADARTTVSAMCGPPIDYGDY